MNARRKQTGNALEKQCVTTANGNAGCGVQAPVNTSGSAFNENGGGVYATEWRDDGIRMWFFGRGDEPSDLTNTTATPDPSTWGEPTADFPDTLQHWQSLPERQHHHEHRALWRLGRSSIDLQRPRRLSRNL
jgi:hypothetical protein